MSPPNRRRSASPKAWKVETQGPRSSAPTLAPSASTRERISLAALFVKVTARIESAAAPCSRIRHAIRRGDDARLARSRAGEHQGRPPPGRRRRPAAGGSGPASAGCSSPVRGVGGSVRSCRLPRTAPSPGPVSPPGVRGRWRALLRGHPRRSPIRRPRTRARPTVTGATRIALLPTKAPASTTVRYLARPS